VAANVLFDLRGGVRQDELHDIANLPLHRGFYVGMDLLGIDRRVGFVYDVHERGTAKRHMRILGTFRGDFTKQLRDAGTQTLFDRDVLGIVKCSKGDFDGLRTAQTRRSRRIGT
jgi:hypothetical protein